MKLKYTTAIGCMTTPVLLGVSAVLLIFYVLGSCCHSERFGQRYMKSLSDDDMQIWITRTETILHSAPPPTLDEIPEDLKKLEIVSISATDNSVWYWWGRNFFSHTALSVRRLPKGGHEVIAVFDKGDEKRLWPKDE